MLVLKDRSLEWAPTAWQRYQARENAANSLPWHLKLAQDESLSLRERCEHARQVFEQRKVASLAMALLGVILPAYITFLTLIVVDAGACVSISISCFVLVGFSPWIYAGVLGAYTARRIALRIKRSLETDSEEPYLPSQSLLHGQYMTLPHSPWYCEVTEDYGEDAALKHSTFVRRMYHRRWIDLVSRDIAPKPSAVDLSLRLATDLKCAARERAEAALVVFSKRFCSYSIAAFILALYAFITGGASFYFIVLGIELDNPVLSLLVVACIASCTGFLLFLAFIVSTGVWVAYHIKLRIHESLRSSAVLELSLSSECVYYIPSRALLRRGFRLVRTYPYYEELEESVQDMQVVEFQPKDVKFREDE